MNCDLYQWNKASYKSLVNFKIHRNFIHTNSDLSDEFNKELSKYSMGWQFDQQHLSNINRTWKMFDIICRSSPSILTWSQIEQLKYLLHAGGGPKPSLSSSYERIFEILKESLQNYPENYKIRNILCYLVESYLKEFDDQIQLATALELVETLNRVNAINQKILNQILFAIAKYCSIDSTRQWIQIMKSFKQDVNNKETTNRETKDMNIEEEVYRNALMVTHIKDKDLHSALQILGLMKHQNISPSVHHYTTLLDGCLQLNKDIFLTVYEDFLMQDLPHTIPLYTVLIRYHLLKDDIESCHTILNRVINSELEITTCFLNIMLEGLLEKSLVQEALILYQRFSEFNLVPDVITYGILIKNYTKLGMVRSAFGLYRQMKKLKILPSLKLWSILIEMFYVGNDIHAAEDCFKELCESRIYQPNSIIISQMMLGSFQSRNYSKVLKYLELGRLYGVKDTSHMKQLLLITKVHLRRPENEFLDLYDDIYTESYSEYVRTNITPPHCQEFYVQLMDAFLSKPLYGKVCFRLYEDLQKLAIDPQPFLPYMFTFSCRHNTTHESLQWLQLMKSSNLPLNPHSYETLLIRLAGMNQWTDIIEVVQYQMSHGKGNSPVAITALLSSYLKKPHEFKSILKELETFGWNYRVYALCIQFYNNENQFYQCWQIWEKYVNECKEKKADVELIVIRAILTACIKFGKPKAIVKVWKQCVKLPHIPKSLYDIENCQSPNGISSKEYIGLAIHKRLD
ncbi:hypothetical protein BC833DRAFT_624017 [Globomyces pollinis-pini]|nr:hypothetical protein BC833DRAFT_624017 [Globomyces pollinis-pini]